MVDPMSKEEPDESIGLCPTCGEGHFRLASARGQTMYYRDAEIELREDLILPTCDECGEHRLNEEDAKKLDGALERSYRKQRREQQHELIESVTNKLAQREVEQILGLSSGYISKAKRGEKVLHSSTYRALLVLNDHPEAWLSTVGRVDPEVRRLASRFR